MEHIKPMLASPPKGERLEHLQGLYAADHKLDGIRAIAYWDGSSLTLVNRSMKDITHRYPDLEGMATVLGSLPVVLDGEIVAKSGSFQDVATRDKQVKPGDVVAAMHKIPVQFVAFDVLNVDGQDVRNQPWFDRRMMLDGLAVLWRDPVLGESSTWTTSVWSMELVPFFEEVKKQGMEGIIAKRLRSVYKSGRFSDWVKYKTVRSITAIGIGYELGEGARAHFGAMNLVLIDPVGQPVSIGKVGTGFTAREIDSLKDQMDSGVPVLVEIECLNVTKDGVLRFPVYKGLRGSELSLADAMLSQLDDIPRC